MTQERWENLVNYIQEQFEVLEHETEEIMEGKGSREYICFSGPLGKIKLAREIKPLVTGRKVLSSRRPGSTVLEELEYSEKEKVDKLYAYQWNEASEDWEEIDANQISKLSS